jgi:hypothetical protein
VDRGRGDVRLTDAERERAAERVHKALYDGRITLDELDRRLAQVYAAVTAADLDAPLAGLPSSREELLLSGELVELDAGRSGLTRSGAWVLPRRLRVQQDIEAHGTVVLDFTSARTTHLVVDLELRLGAWGAAHLVLPPGGTADLGRVAGPGRPARTEVPTESTGHALHLVVSGRAPRRSAVRVGYRWRWWWAVLQ